MMGFSFGMIGLYFFHWYFIFGNPNQENASVYYSYTQRNSNSQIIKHELYEINNTAEDPRKSTGESNQKESNKDGGNKNIAAQTFTFRELATATKNFRQECLVGEGGFGRVYKGRLEKTGQVIIIHDLSLIIWDFFIFFIFIEKICHCLCLFRLQL